MHRNEKNMVRAASQLVKYIVLLFWFADYVMVFALCT